MERLTNRSFILLRVLFCVLVLGCGTKQAGNTSFKVELQHSYADHVFLVYAKSDDVAEVEMLQISDKIYLVSVDLDDGEEYLVNFKVTSDKHPDSALWVAKKWGIDAKVVDVAGVQITNDYLVRTMTQPPAAFSIVCSNGEIRIGNDHEKWNVSKPIPPEVSGHKKYVRLRLPPDGFTAGLPWMQALHIGDNNSVSKVEVDYMRLYAHTSDGDVLLQEDDYSADTPFKGYDHGGTYLRHPFFYDEENNNWAMPAEVQQGALVIYPFLHADRVFHWWLSERVVIPTDAEYLIMEAKVRITGDACVQAGIDFWVDTAVPYAGLDVNNTEAGLSDFLFQSSEWQILTLSTEHLIAWDD